MRFRYEAHKVVTVNREDVSTALVERVLRALVFEGSPYVTCPDYPKYLDAASFTLTKEGDKDMLRVEYDFVGEHESYDKAPLVVPQEVDELLDLLSDERAAHINIPLTDADMTMYVECDLAKGLLEYRGEPVAEPLSNFCGVDTTNTNWDLVLDQAILTAQVSLHLEQPTTTNSAGVPAKEAE